MTDWGAHHFGGATFAVDVRELQPVEVIYNDDKDGKYVTFLYPNGLLFYHNQPGQGNLQVEGTPGETRPAKPVPTYKGEGGIYGDFIDCVKTREKPFRDIELAVNTVAREPPGQHRLRAAAVAEMGSGQAGIPRRRRGQSPAGSGPSRAVAVIKPLGHLTRLTQNLTASTGVYHVGSSFRRIENLRLGHGPQSAQSDRRGRDRHARQRRGPQGFGSPTGRSARDPRVRATRKILSAAS